MCCLYPDYHLWQVLLLKLPQTDFPGLVYLLALPQPEFLSELLLHRFYPLTEFLHLPHPAQVLHSLQCLWLVPRLLLHSHLPGCLQIPDSQIPQPAPPLPLQSAYDQFDKLDVHLLALHNKQLCMYLRNLL